MSAPITAIVSRFTSTRIAENLDFTTKSPRHQGKAKTIRHEITQVTEKDRIPLRFLSCLMFNSVFLGALESWWKKLPFR
jgi:hypothetical protein